MTTIRKRSQKQEREGAKRHGGRVNPGSGNGWVHKNDVRTEETSIEYKITDKKSYSLKEDDLLEAEKNAILSGRDALFAISFGRSGRNWVVISEEDYLTLKEPCPGLHFRHMTEEDEEADQW